MIGLVSDFIQKLEGAQDLPKRGLFQNPRST